MNPKKIELQHKNTFTNPCLNVGTHICTTCCLMDVAQLDFAKVADRCSHLIKLYNRISRPYMHPQHKLHTFGRFHKRTSRSQRERWISRKLSTEMRKQKQCLDAILKELEIAKSLQQELHERTQLLLSRMNKDNRTQCSQKQM